MSSSKSDNLLLEPYQQPEVTDDSKESAKSELDSVKPEHMDDGSDGWDDDASEVEGRTLHLFLDVRNDLYEHAYAYMSIESAKLKINDKSKGPRSVYGEIKVKTGLKDKCIYIYHRHGHEAEQVPEVDDDEDGFDLTLCGPNHCLVAPDVWLIDVFLYEKGVSQPFLTGPFYLRNKKLDLGTYGEPVTMCLDLPDDGGKLSLCFTRFCNSIPVRLQFLVIDDGEAEAEAGGSKQRVVEGTIKAKHIPCRKPNWLTILKTGPVTVPSGEPIPLPRSVFVMTVQGDEPEEKVGSLKIVADLKVVQPDDDGGGEYYIKGETDIVLHKSYILEEPHYFTLKDTTLKRKHGAPCLQLKISVTPEHESCPAEDREYLIHA